MDLSEKLRHLRAIEGGLRGLGRPLTKAEVVQGMRAELSEAISHPYLCQLENGSRTHMTARTRELLARFFKVHPGYLVSDPSGYATGLVSDVASPADNLRVWLGTRAEEAREDPVVYHTSLQLARDPEPRRYFVLLNHLLDLPADVVSRLLVDFEQAVGESGAGT